MSTPTARHAPICTTVRATDRRTGQLIIIDRMVDCACGADCPDIQQIRLQRALADLRIALADIFARRAGLS